MEILKNINKWFSIMKIVTIIGYTNSGKTTTVVEIIRELRKRGKSVATVKNIHIENFSIDTEGKDSWKHKNAGASITGVRSNLETAIILKGRKTAKDLILLFNTDYLILEGFSDEPFIPKVLCGKNTTDLDQRIDETVFVISGVISNDLKEYQERKIINALTNISKLVDLIEKKATTVEDFLKHYY